MSKLLASLKAVGAKVAAVLSPVIRIGREILKAERVLATVAGLVLAAAGVIGHIVVSDYNRQYNLVHMETIEGIPTPVEKLLVDKVQHQPDGAVCFHGVQDDHYGCIKANYLLIQAE